MLTSDELGPEVDVGVAGSLNGQLEAGQGVLEVALERVDNQWEVAVELKGSYRGQVVNGRLQQKQTPQKSSRESGFDGWKGKSRASVPTYWLRYRRPLQLGRMNEEIFVDQLKGF